MGSPIVINLDKCVGCKKCIASCAFDALSMDGNKAALTGDCRACFACVKACPFKAIEKAVQEETSGTADKASYKGIWVFAEQRHGKIQEVAYELLTQGLKLAKDRGCKLEAVLLGHNVTDLGPSLIAAGADKVHVVDLPELAVYDADAYTDALNQLIAQYKPEMILAGATAIGRSFFAKVAVRARTGLTADCTALSIDPDSKLLWQTRPAFGGNIMATIMCPNHRPQMATVRPKVFKMDAPDPRRQGEVLVEALKNVLQRTKLVKEQHETNLVNIAEAEIIIAGGRGMGKAENFGQLRELAQLVGGVVGASRACVDSGWISVAHQVGQTGKTVCPKIYMAFGISGAIQHTAGMSASDFVIAVNRDPRAPIFDIADLGIVGDVFEIVPLLIKAVKQAKGL